MAARLRAVPETAPRALALIRVSKEREGMISPELQDAAIGDYCARHGMQIVDRMEGIDESGSGSRSRWWAKLDAAVTMVEDGLVDVIVVWKFSRTARHRLRWAVALDRVETAGGRLESATEQVDTTTSTGRFTRGMLAELNAFEAERIGESWKEAQARRRSLGLPHDGGPRPGYIYEDKAYRPDPETAPLVADAYRRYVNGIGAPRIAAWWQAAGLLPPRRGQRPVNPRWDDRSVLRVLDTGWAAGLMRVHDPVCGCANKNGGCGRYVWLPGAHESIIDEKLWQGYQAERARRSRTPRRLLTPSTPLSGLVRCSSCGYGMRVKNGPRATNSRLYACVHDSCTLPTTVVIPRAEAAVLEWLAGYAHNIDEATAVADSDRSSRAAAKAAVTRLARGVNQLDAEMSKLVREYARGVIPEGAYLAARDELAGERAAAAAALEEASRLLGRARPSRKVAADLLRDWSIYDVGDRNRICRELLRVVVARGGYRSVVTVVPAWEWRPPDRP